MSKSQPTSQRPMRVLYAAVGVSIAALSLVACEKTTPTPPTPTVTPTATPAVTPAPAETTAAAGSASAADPAASTSVPPADAVLPATTAAPKADHAPGRTLETPTPAQESATMPMPGQANDHSAPKAPAGRASAP